MTELERLTKLIESAMYWGADTPEKIAERLIEDGVICPPCKVGDIIYALTYDGKYCMPLKVTCRESLVRWMDEDQFGNVLFTTREEAEAALAERRTHAKMD